MSSPRPFRPVLSLLACDRSAPNAHSTLASAAYADPRAAELVTVLSLDAPTFMGTSYEIYNHLPNVHVHASGVDGPPSSLRAKHNYVRALQRAVLHAGSDRSDGVLVLEDDLIFSRQWLDLLQEAVRLGRQHVGPDFVLLGYCGRVLSAADRVDAETHPFLQPTLVPHPDREPLWGSLALWWPFERVEWAAEMLSAIPGEPCDVILGEMLRGEGVPLLVVLPNFVQHVGDGSSGTSVLNRTQGARRSSSFRA